MVQIHSPRPILLQPGTYGPSDLLVQNQEVRGSNYNALPFQKVRNLVPAGNLPNEIDLCLSIWSSIRMQHLMKPDRRLIKNIRMLP